MNPASLFRRIVALLNSAEIPYMLTGSFASSAYGTPRTTQDIDIVIGPSRRTLEALLDSLPEATYYVERDTAREALGNHGQFNVIDLETGWKLDFIVRKSRPFSREEFERRRTIELFGTEMSIATAEDTLISKLEWAKFSGSDRQIEDAVGILRTAGSRLDLHYIERWVGELGLDFEWRRARNQAASDR